MAEINKTSNVPQFLVVGTAKAGTTSLYHYLKQHPKINIPIKETFFFMRDVYQNISLKYPKQRSDEPLYKLEEEYLKAYENVPGMVGEIGTGYLYYYKESVPLIQKYLGEDVKILIILRNPIERCFSSYKHFTKDLFEVDTFEESLELESFRIAQNWDFMWHYKALGLYYEQVKYYQAHFKHVKVVLYDDLKKNPQNLMSEILSFIGIEEPFEFKTEAVFNESGTPKSKWMHKLIVHDHWFKRNLITPIMKALFPYALRDKIRKYIRNQNFKKSDIKMLPATRQKLQAYYKVDIEKLAQLLGRDLSHWLA